MIGAFRSAAILGSRSKVKREEVAGWFALGVKRVRRGVYPTPHFLAKEAVSD